jgi:cytochrome c-type biogenesis protein CcmE
VPDTFKGEAEVVLRGKLTSTGFHTEPNGVTAKCPSKYEAQAAAGSPGL